MGDVRTTRSMLIVAADAVLPTPPSIGTSNGFPGRTSRNEFGVDMVDERHTVDPSKEINAANVNLAFWQMGGMGLGAPKAVMYYKFGFGKTPTTFEMAVFAWDSVVYRLLALDDWPSYVSAFLVGTGDVIFNFTPTVPGRPDADGLPTANPLNIIFASAYHQFELSSVQQAEVEILSLQSVRVRVSFGNPGVPTNADFALAIF